MVSVRLERLLIGAVSAVLLAVTSAAAQGRALTIDAIYDPDTRIDFSGSPPGDLTWIDATHYLWLRRASAGEGREWVKVDAASGQAAPFLDVAKMEEALAALPGISREEAVALVRSGEITFNPRRTGGLLQISGDLYYYDFTSARASRLTAASGEEEEPSFSPDGRLVAFVRHHNLFVVDLEGQRDRALTTDGSAEILNGKLDWLYQEEIYGRGRFRGYWWSPDSSRLAFLRLDERPVPEYTVVDHIPYRPTLEVTDYPKAGDPNPTVKLATVRVAGGDAQWMDLSAYGAIEFLIVNVSWTPDSTQVLYQVQNREQTWLDQNAASVLNGRSRTLLKETSKAWVDPPGNPVWLKDGTFLWFSERTGFRHLYHHRSDGTELRGITSGRWDVRSLYGVDEAGGWIYYSGTEHGVTAAQIYRVRLDGSARTRLSKAEGTHRASFNPNFGRFIGWWSDVNTPTQVRLHNVDGSELRVIDANAVKGLREFPLSKPEFLQIKARDGFVMEAIMIKPPDFNPSRRYPVFQHTYAGPGAQQVLNSWRGTEGMFFQLLAQRGFIVWILDNRSASGKGVESQWPVYGRLGEVELQDLEDGVAWLKQQPYIDASRILMSGWSYGGFMVSYAMTHSTSFAAGIIGAPVTDWRNYDSVYTERLMKLPQNNPQGYERTAPAKAAERLHGRALILHGTIDDNVHMQNTIQFAYELQQKGKTFELMVYPKSRHGVTDMRLNKHLRQLMLDFALRTIGEVGSAKGEGGREKGETGRAGQVGRPSATASAPEGNKVQ